MTLPSRATLSWQSGMRFLARSESGHDVLVESVAEPGHTGASPIELLLIGVAACTAMDVVAILQKMREPLAGLEVAIRGERADRNPKRFTSIEITYRLKGSGIRRDKAERAVELSQSTYCSVLASLRADCRISSTIEIGNS